MSGGFSRLLWRFWHDERGAAMLMFLTVIVPLLLVLAVAIDLSQILVVKRQLTGAVDSASLTLGVLPALNDDDAHSKAESYVRAHYKEAIGKLTDVAVVRSDEIINVTATAEIPMTFLRVAGYDKVTVAVSSQAVRKENKLEVVMVLDNSGSMGGNKLTALKDAASTLVTTLMPRDTSDQVRIGLVPFMGAVNVGSGNRTASWMDETTPAPLNYEHITDLPQGTSLFKLFDDMHNHASTVNWGGCVRARTEPYDLNDTAPSSDDSRTLFTPYFAPDEAGDAPNVFTPDYQQPFVNNYMGGPLGNTMANASKYATENAINTARVGPNARCPSGQIQPLTNVKSDILAAIDSMDAVGITVIPEGLAWGWRVISPGAPFTEGVDYADTDTIKVVILMTDGDNEVTPWNPRQDASLGSYFSAFGYAEQTNSHLKTPPSSEITDVNATYTPNQVLDMKLSAVCKNIKAIKKPDDKEAIIIYTIVFNQNSENVKTLLRNCASTPSNFFDTPTNDDLEAAFQTIANGLNQLRIAR